MQSHIKHIKVPVEKKTHGFTYSAFRMKLTKSYICSFFKFKRCILRLRPICQMICSTILSQVALIICKIHSMFLQNNEHDFFNKIYYLGLTEDQGKLYLGPGRTSVWEGAAISWVRKLYVWCRPNSAPVCITSSHVTMKSKLGDVFKSISANQALGRSRCNLIYRVQLNIVICKYFEVLMIIIKSSTNNSILLILFLKYTLL